MSKTTKTTDDVEPDTPIPGPEPSASDDIVAAPDGNPEVIIPPAGSDLDLITAVAAAMADAGQVTKSSVNRDQGYQFASAEAILAAVRLALLKRGVILTMHPQGFETSSIKADGRGNRIVATIDFAFRKGDEVLTIAGWRGVGEDYGDKAIGKAYTSALKTFIRSQWLLPTEHDDPENSDNREPEAAELPVWARPATSEQKKAMVAALAPVFGGDVVKAVGVNIAAAIGYMPEGFTAFAVALANASAAAAAPAEEAAAAQDALAEQPDTPAPEPTVEPEQIADRPEFDDRPVEQQIAEMSDEQLTKIADSHVNDEVSALAVEEIMRRGNEALAAEAALQAEPVEEEPPPPASVDAPTDLPSDPAKAIGTLKAAGCTCEDPLAIRHAEPKLDPACPLKGHGIPF